MPYLVDPDSADAPSGDWIGSGSAPSRPRAVGWLTRLTGGRPVRLDPGRTGASALVVTAVVSALLAAVVIWLARSGDEDIEPVRPTASAGFTAGPSAVDDPEPSSEPPAGPSAAATSAGAEIVVSVVGTVAKPGLVTLPAGARVADALAAAGGVLPGVDTTALNLARRLTDGEQIAVGVPAAEQPAPPPADGPPANTAGAALGGVPSGPVDLNAATLADLDTLPGIGPVIAQRILDYREANGPFQSTDQLQEVSGIGPATFAKLADLVTV